MGALDRRLEDAIRTLLASRSGSLCPSEAARAVDPGGWRDLMERARAAGRRLAGRDEIVVLQRGRGVDPSRAKGPIRFGRGAQFPAASPRRAR